MSELQIYRKPGYTAQDKSQPPLHRYSLLIIALVIIAYLVSLSAVTQVALFDLRGSVVYRGKTGAALICIVRWDADSVNELMDAAESAQAPITFFITPQWARTHSTLVQRMQQNHAIGLLGSAQSEKDFRGECEEFRALGLSSDFYMPSEDEKARQIAQWADTQSVRVVLSSFDILSRSSEPQDAVTRIRENAFAGCIIRFEPTVVMKSALPDAMQALKDAGFSLTTLEVLMGDQKI